MKKLSAPSVHFPEELGSMNYQSYSVKTFEQNFPAGVFTPSDWEAHRATWQGLMPSFSLIDEPRPFSMTRSLSFSPLSTMFFFKNLLKVLSTFSSVHWARYPGLIAIVTDQQNTCSSGISPSICPRVMYYLKMFSLPRSIEMISSRVHCLAKPEKNSHGNV